VDEDPIAGDVVPRTYVPDGGEDVSFVLALEQELLGRLRRERFLRSF
jgi:hypothetical protein